MWTYSVAAAAAAAAVLPPLSPEAGAEEGHLLKLVPTQALRKAELHPQPIAFSEQHPLVWNLACPGHHDGLARDAEHAAAAEHHAVATRTAAPTALRKKLRPHQARLAPPRMQHVFLHTRGTKDGLPSWESRMMSTAKPSEGTTNKEAETRDGAPIADVRRELEGALDRSSAAP